MTRSSGMGRRGALLTLAGMVPAVAVRAQVPPPIATPAPPQLALPAPIPSAPRPPTPPVTAIDKTKIYYVMFDLAIDLNSMRALRHQLANLVEAGVTQIVLVINSLGGQVLETLVTYSFIRSLPVEFSTHAQGLVASSAMVLFLAGEARSADPTARFVFHPTQTTLLGPLTQQQIQEQGDQVEAVVDAAEQIYRDRTSLTSDQIASFRRGEVIFKADQASQLGIVQTVALLKIPGPQTARIIFVE